MHEVIICRNGIPHASWCSSEPTPERAIARVQFACRVTGEHVEGDTYEAVPSTMVDDYDEPVTDDEAESYARVDMWGLMRERGIDPTELL